MLLVKFRNKAIEVAENFMEATAKIFGTLAMSSKKAYSLETPVAGPSAVTSRPAHARTINGVTRLHAGVDFGVRPLGSRYAARAVIDGKVVFSGWMRGYGNVVVIEDDTWCYLYAHLENRAVSVGQAVKVGAPLGTIGHTGGKYATHLHFEIRPAGQWRISATHVTVDRMLEYLRLRGL